METLPQGWTREFSRSRNKEYYFNAHTGQSVWTLDEVNTLEQEKRGKKRKLGDDDTVSNNENKKQMHGTRILPKVAIIVPFRDLHEKQQRRQHLEKFVPYMIDYLGNKCKLKEYKVYIIEQSNDGRKFNRGKLLNIGFNEAKNDGYNVFIFHDVDLLPQDALIPYYKTIPLAGSPIHIAKCWDRYNNNPKYLGGIISFNTKDFEHIDGFPNIFFGWGGEDDELQKRVDHFKYNIVAPAKNLKDAIVDLEEMDLSTKLKFLKQNADWKCKVKWEVLKEHDKFRNKQEKPPWWGLNHLKYNIKKKYSEPFDSDHCVIINVDVLYNFNDIERTSPHWSNTKTEWD